MPAHVVEKAVKPACFPPGRRIGRVLLFLLSGIMPESGGPTREGLCFQG
jgi:hypothetical protein